MNNKERHTARESLEWENRGAIKTRGGKYLRNRGRINTRREEGREFS